MMVFQATHDDVAAVATLHIKVFPSFFLTSLGQKFLEELYMSYLSHPSAIFMVSRDKNMVVGFVAGTSDPSVFFSDLRKQRKFFFLFKALPTLLKNPMPVIRKLLSSMTYNGDTSADVKNSSLLSSIGVDSAYRGTGLSTALIHAFESKAHSHGSNSVYLLTDETENIRANMFYTKIGYQVILPLIKEKSRKMLRYEKTL